jgi:hypothetical protein
VRHLHHTSVALPYGVVLLNRFDLLMSRVTADTSSAGDSDSDDSVGFFFPYFFDDIPDDPMAMNYATINIQSHVPIKLELRSPNYTKWKAFFESLCGKFGLLYDG